MPDGLTQEERALAWAASWHPSFSGTAVVNKDFTFRSVNPQFCKIVGVTPAELLGKNFQDITPPDIRELDISNAQLVMEGRTSSYLLPKSYEFASGKRVNVLLLVRGVFSIEGEFLFFVSSAMLDEEKSITLPAPSPPQTSLWGFIMENAKGLFGAGAVIGGIAVAIYKYWNGE